MQTQQANTEVYSGQTKPPDPPPSLHEVGAARSLDHLSGVGLGFDESLRGYLGIGQFDPVEGEAVGRRQGTSMRMVAHVAIDDLPAFLDVSQHTARLSGHVSISGIGSDMAIVNGTLAIFGTDVDTGVRQLAYDFACIGDDGAYYVFHGVKTIHDECIDVDVLHDMTTLAVTVRKGLGVDAGGDAGEDAGEDAPVYAAGMMSFALKDVPRLLASMTIEGARSYRQKAAAYVVFFQFVFGALHREYLRNQSITYGTRYKNAVLRGRLRTADGRGLPFMLVSGKHDTDFPWGDGEGFCDMLLVIGDPDTADCRRYCISRRILAGLSVDIAGGHLRYRGPIYRLVSGTSTSFTEMATGSARLLPGVADIAITFAATAQGRLSLPFACLSDFIAHLDRAKRRLLAGLIPDDADLGIQLTPYALTDARGYIRLSSGAVDGKGGEGEGEDDRAGAGAGGSEVLARHETSDSASGSSSGLWATVESAQTFGEGERATLRNLREPTLRYGYICAVDPQAPGARVQIETDTVRDEREHWTKDRLDAVAGRMIGRAASADFNVKAEPHPIIRAGHKSSLGKRGPQLEVCGQPVLEVRNDHYPTAVFLRRIIPVKGSVSGQAKGQAKGQAEGQIQRPVQVLDDKVSLALEESMSCMRLEPINCGRTVTVASVCDPDAVRALDQVLEQTGFIPLVERAVEASGKSREAFRIAIKPNFMFSYNRRDRSTYTDPALVAHLAKRLRERGFVDIAVVEAHSTYGEFFDRRSVREMADYLGYRESDGYRIVDLTQEATGSRHFGPHLGAHPVSPTWRDADFRISFAKNKTHSYAYYTLTLKNIYGALPLGNKFKEYHCKRDIYHTTIELLQAFPVHYGLVDAYLSADGPFGVFSDTDPNPTKTIIGGADLVAVDWVAASKMGIDPMLSPYMPLAVNAFGKPAIDLVGDDRVYRPWLNVPESLTLLTHGVIDKDYFFGNLFYMAGAQMDESHFHLKGRARGMRFVRRLIQPLRYAIFVRTNASPSVLNRLVSWGFYKLGL